WQIQALRQIRINRLDRYAKHAAAHLASLHQLIHHGLGHIRRNRETDTDVAAGWRQNLRVDPDQLTADVDKCTTGVTAVNRGVSLQKVFETAITQTRRTTFRTHDARSDGLTDAERVTHREHRVADANLVGITE